MPQFERMGFASSFLSDIFKPPLGLDDLQRAALEGRDAGGVVAPVFQRRKPRHEP
jgi:hypothetical protein